jgi:hypothetical protein
MVLEVVAVIIGVLMLLSRYLEAAKPVWSRMPRAVAVLLPAVVSLIPQVVALVQQTKTWLDLMNYLIASAAIVIVGMFPEHPPKPPTPPAVVT